MIDLFVDLFVIPNQELKELLSLTAREKHLETFAETIAYIG